MTDRFNAQTYLVTRNVDEGLGDKVAVRAGADTATYADLDGLCGTVAAALRETGVRSDDRVLMMMSDGLPMLAAILGCFRAGAVAVPVSTMQTAQELGTVLADSGARLVVCTPEFTEAVEGALPLAPEVERLVVVGEPTLAAPAAVGQTSWDEFLATGREAPDARRSVADTDADAWALWLYTSGTTGLPKAAMHRHANIRHVCETYGQQVLGIRRDDVTFSVAKLFFAYGIGNSLFFPFSVGATTVLEAQRPTPAIVRERVGAEQPTLFFAVPTFYAALLSGDLPDDTFASVRLAASAGEALPGPAADEVPGPVRRRHHRRHRLHRGPAHLLVQPSRRHPSRHDRQGRAGVRRRGCRRGRSAPPARSARGAAGPRRVDRARLLETDRRVAAGLPG